MPHTALWTCICTGMRLFSRVVHHCGREQSASQSLDPQGRLYNTASGPVRSDLIGAVGLSERLHRLIHSSFFLRMCEMLPKYVQAVQGSWYAKPKDDKIVATQHFEQEVAKSAPLVFTALLAGICLAPLQLRRWAHPAFVIGSPLSKEPFQILL